ncbi:GNAT family N-acetyltransferase [Streptomyces sp. NPDC059785]|uniref:GNAT family N-acetyltransferase n=1 Tax=unclassified Streptomyces TaxID=2593676 RepID=UPI00364E6010
MNHVIRPIRTGEWAAVKELRLTALQDPAAPLAFLETYEDAVGRSDAYWQERTDGAAEGQTERQQFVAEGPDGVWAGSVTVLVEKAGAQEPFGGVVERDQAHVVGVFVRVGQRGSGLIGALLDAALEWSWERGLERVRLYVHERNPRAEAAYRKAGFVPSGGTAAVPGNSDDRELELVIERPSGML